jgi:iron complex outermembrane recepter protein
MRHQQPAIARVGRLASAIALVLSGATVATSADAQPAAADGSEDRSLEEITVTGSRIRRDDFSSPQPTTVMDNEYLQNLGVINLGQAMVGVPQNVNRNSPDANAGSSFFNGSTLANLRGLNPFFGTRTLTLVDSRRHVPTNQGDGVDLNFIPTILIDRVETVTGGASASYGSGAIGGVQNILLDRDYEGIKAEVDYGTSGEGDGESTHYGFAWGTGIGESGQLVLGVEGEDSEGIYKCASARDWCGTNTGTITNWTFATPGWDGRPQNLVLPNVREAWNSRNGVFWLPGGSAGNPRVPQSGTPVVGVQLNPAGNGLVNFDPGVGGDGFFAAQTLGGEGEGIYEDTVLRSPVERTIGYASYTTDFSERLGFFVEASAGTTETLRTEGGFTAANYTCIRPDNAYVQLNPALAAFVNANNAGGFGAFPCFGLPPGTPGFPAGLPGGVALMKNWENQIDSTNNASTDLTRVAVGFDGSFGDSSWTWDAYYQWGKAEREQLLDDLVHENRYNYAIDTVLVGGVPTCRSVADPNVLTPVASSNITNTLGRLVADPSLRIGCQPLNPFGTGPIPAAAKAYAFGFIRENTDVEQNMAEFVASGDIAEGFGAGSLKAAAGISFRSEELSNLAAEELGDAIRRDFAIQYGESFAGDVDVLELFTEFDLPFHERFALNAAARHSEYTNTAGFGTPDPGAEYKYNIDTWKVGAQIDVVPALSIRLSQSRDIRAPNQRELYYGQVFTPGSFFGFIAPPFSTNPWTNTTAQDPVASTLYGGARNGVLPEEADTTTIGFIIQPGDSGLRLAVDYFDITLENSISPANLSITIQGCFAGIQSYCDKITSGVQTPWQNPSLDHNGNPTPGLGPKDTIPCPAECFIDIENYYSETFNAGTYDIKGLDFTLDWFKELDNGSFMVRFLGTRTFEQNVTIIRTPFGQVPETNIVGAVGSPVGFLSDYASAADFTGSLTATWQRGSFSLTGNMRYVDDGIVDRTRTGPDQPGFNAAVPGSVLFNTVDSYEIYSTTAMYDFSLSGGNMLQLWGSINNLTDEDPPLLGGATGGTNAIFYSTAGREYRVGLRLGF